MYRRAVVLLGVLAALSTVHCAGETDASTAPSGDIAADDQDVKAAPDGSHALFLGKWESTTKSVAKVGPLPFETNIRSLEFKSDRDDSSSLTRYRLVLVVRPDCSDCKDQTFAEGTYRSIATTPGDLAKGKIYTTEGGNTSSRAYYEIDGDILRLKSTGLGAEGRTVIRELKRVR
jgi:hypothetical protein